MTIWQEGWFENGGVRLHYHRTGGAKPAAVLLHGITDNGLCWTKLALALEPDYDLIMLDARGHGLSDRAGSYLPENHLEDIVALIQSLNLEQPAVLGHSMGATNALHFAARYPRLLTALLLEDPPWALTPASPQSDEADWHKTIAVNRTRTLEDLMAEAELTQPTWSPEEFPAWAEAKRQVSPEVVSWLHGGETLNHWREVLAKLRCPTLLITGDTDVRVTPAVAEEARRLCKTLEVAQLANAGHSIRRDQFEAYLKVVKAFLAKVF
jgi:pimeloyl-ACP methyl ester carboxylesterase